MSNALAAIAVAVELGASADQVRDSLKAFGGVKRRFTPVGEWNGVKVIDDYAHHPVEIMACLKAARAIQGQGRVIAISQPHRFSRLEDLFDEFAQCYREADIAVITPVFAAGEVPIDGIDHVSLVSSMRGHGHKQAQVLDDLDSLPDLIREIAAPGDMVVCMGAGSISSHANDLIERLNT
ncbi:MAG: cyanophycin synthetase [Pseudomonadota bacterium]|nr:cyanophycin synthetase [Pseudomonadota bacterium]